MCTWIPFSIKSWSITMHQWSSLWHHPWRQCNCEIRWSYLTWIWARQSSLTKALPFRMAPRTVWDPHYWTTLWARCFWTGHLSLLMYLLAHFNIQVWFRMWLAHSLWRCSVCKYHIIIVPRLRFHRYTYLRSWCYHLMSLWVSADGFKPIVWRLDRLPKEMRIFR